MKRRDFLGATAIFAAGSGTAHAALSTFENGLDQTAQLADRLLNAFPDRQSLAAIGHAYWREDGLGRSRENGDLPAALRDLLTHVGLKTIDLDHMKPDTIRRLIKAGNSEDFAQNRTIWVKGWLLAETEARLCALAALSST